MTLLFCTLPVQNYFFLEEEKMREVFWLSPKQRSAQHAVAVSLVIFLPLLPHREPGYDLWHLATWLSTFFIEMQDKVLKQNPRMFSHSFNNDFGSFLAAAVKSLISFEGGKKKKRKIPHKDQTKGAFTHI